MRAKSNTEVVPFMSTAPRCVPASVQMFSCQQLAMSDCNRPDLRLQADRIMPIAECLSISTERVSFPAGAEPSGCACMFACACACAAHLLQLCQCNAYMYVLLLHLIRSFISSDSVFSDRVVRGIIEVSNGVRNGARRLLEGLLERELQQNTKLEGSTNPGSELSEI